MRIAIGSDHGGFQLKEILVDLLVKMAHDVDDHGCDSEESVDYPSFANSVSEKVGRGDADAGILVCGTGIGMSIAANRNRKIRASLCHDEYSARMSREHNKANILCLGARVIGSGLAQEIVKVWLATEFAGGRHQQRINQFSD